MGRITVLDDQAGDLVPLLASAGIEAEGFTAPEDMVASAPETEILLASPVGAAAVAGRLGRLQWIQSTWAGVDALLAAGIPEGVVLTGVQGVFGTQMREFVFGHLLAHTQRVVERTVARRWNDTPPPVLAGSRIGVLGTGSIGRSLAATARHLDMTVVGCSRSGRAVDPFDAVHPVSERLDFADSLDHLVAALPATPDTDRLVDEDLLERLAPAATFVNVGRGSTADVAAVVAALERQALSLAVLDVLPAEPLPEGDPLWDVPGLVITSHTAAWSRPADIARLFVENLRRHEAGQALQHVIDPERGY